MCLRNAKLFLFDTLLPLAAALWGECHHSFYFTQDKMKERRVHTAYKFKAGNSNTGLPGTRPKLFPQHVCMFVRGQQKEKSLTQYKQKISWEEEWGEECSCLPIYNLPISSKTHRQRLFACVEKNARGFFKNQDRRHHGAACYGGLRSAVEPDSCSLGRCLPAQNPRHFICNIKDISPRWGWRWSFWKYKALHTGDI